MRAAGSAAKRLRGLAQRRREAGSTAGRAAAVTYKTVTKEERAEASANLRRKAVSRAIWLRAGRLRARRLPAALFKTASRPWEALLAAALAALLLFFSFFPFFPAFSPPLAAAGAAHGAVQESAKPFASLISFADYSVSIASAFAAYSASIPFVSCASVSDASASDVPASAAFVSGASASGASAEVSFAGDAAFSSGVSFLNDRSAGIIGAAVGARGLVSAAGLTGQGQIIGLADSGLDSGRMDDLHPDLQSIPGRMPRVAFLRSWTDRAVPDDPVGHGTHMAAALVGSGEASNGQFQGIAPNASLYFQALLDSKGQLSPPADLNTLFYPAYAAGVRIHVDGWGGGSNAYGSEAAQIDAFVRRYPDFLPVFGAGNSGPGKGTLTAEANSKNALVVGAAQSPRPAFGDQCQGGGEVASFSSRGPAADGRIKPDLVVPGSAVISACSRLTESNFAANPAYTRLGGTSMSAAAAGGALALLREYLVNELRLAAPSAALMKAALINGASPVKTACGEAESPQAAGFGQLDLAQTVLALKEGRFRLADNKEGIATGETREYTFTVKSSESPVKVTLAWTDPAAPAGAAAGGGNALVNDLDLVVESPDGKRWAGNHFLGANPDSPDRLNNVEQVCLPQPVPGVYRVTVKAAKVTQPATGRAAGSYAASGAYSYGGDLRQDFALVYGQTLGSGTLRSVSSAGAGSGGASGGGSGGGAFAGSSGRAAWVLELADGRVLEAGEQTVYLVREGSFSSPLEGAAEGGTAGSGGGSAASGTGGAEGAEGPEGARDAWGAESTESTESAKSTVSGQSTGGGTGARSTGTSISAGARMSAAGTALPAMQIKADQIPPGSEVYVGEKGIYAFVDVWEAGGVQALGTSAGTLVVEMKSGVREGGYYVNPAAPQPLWMNSRPVSYSNPFLPGAEIKAVINPRTQTIWRGEGAGVQKSSVIAEVNAEAGTLRLLDEAVPRPVSPQALVSYLDTLAAVDAANAPFGDGEISSLERLLPGMPVNAVVSPLSGEVLYIAGKRELAIGWLAAVDAGGGQIELSADRRRVYRLFPGAPVTRDGQDSTLAELKAGDYVEALLLPATDTVLRLAAYSRVDYGQVLFISERSGTLQLLNSRNCFKLYQFDAGTAFYRWGLPINPASVQPGSWVRVTLDPAGERVLRLVAAETEAEVSGTLLRRDDSGYIYLKGSASGGAFSEGVFSEGASSGSAFSGNAPSGNVYSGNISSGNMPSGGISSENLSAGNVSSENMFSGAAPSASAASQGISAAASRTAQGSQRYFILGPYYLGPSARITQEGYCLTASDLVPGEKLTLTLLKTPSPWAPTVASVTAEPPAEAEPPLLEVRAWRHGSGYALSGFTTGTRVYLYRGEEQREALPVEGGRFSAFLPAGGASETVRVVAIDGESGALSSQRVHLDMVFEGGFSDTVGHWAEKSIGYLALEGILCGFPDGRFYPERLLTREEAAVLALRLWERMQGKAAAGGGESGAPAALAAAGEGWRSAAGGIAAEAVVEGTGEGRRMAGGGIAGEVAGEVAGEAPGRGGSTAGGVAGEAADRGIGGEIGGGEASSGVHVLAAVQALLPATAEAAAWPAAAGFSLREVGFHDGEEISAWARPLVEKARACGLVRGYPDGTFRPREAITPAEMAQLLSNVLRAAELGAVGLAKNKAGAAKSAVEMGGTVQGGECEDVMEKAPRNALRDALENAPENILKNASKNTQENAPENVPRWARPAVEYLCRRGVIAAAEAEAWLSSAAAVSRAQAAVMAERVIKSAAG